MSRGAHTSTRKPANSEAPGTRAGRNVLPALTIVWHPDVARIGEICLLEQLAAGKSQAVSRLAPEFARPGGEPKRALEHAHVSRATSLTLMPRARGEIELRVEESGSLVEVQGVPITGSTSLTAEEVGRGVIILVARTIVLCLHRLQAPVERGPPMELLGVGDGMERVRQLVRRVAGVEVPVLIRGETGTGKEMVARALVAASRRADRPFVAVNMAAISPTTAVAEMFGHERGAFTGAAAARRGYFGEAAGGTLLLDEVGLTPPELQRMLLRVLETGEYVPVGASRARPADVRILAATDANLEADMASRAFSEPLFQRLAGFQVSIPPLRRRREDIGALLLHFLTQELESLGRTKLLDEAPTGKRPWLSSSQAAQFALGEWPGNVRGLRNAVRQMVISSSDDPRALIDEGIERLMQTSRTAASPGEDLPTATASNARLPSKAAVDPNAFMASFRRNRFSASATAAELGIPRTTVYSLLERHPDVTSVNAIPADELKRQHAECGGDLERMARRLGVSRRGLQLRLAQVYKETSAGSRGRSGPKQDRKG